MALRSLLTPTFALALLLAGCSGEPSGRGEGPLGSNGGNGAGGSGSGAGPAEGSGGGLIPVPDEDEPQNEDCGTVLPVVYRDFTEAHPDFEMQFSGDEVRLQLVEATLGPDSKPVFRDSVGCPWGINEDPPTPRECDPYWSPDIPVITSAETFDQWYRDVEGVNQTFVKELELTESPTEPGKFVYESSEFFPLGPDEGFGVSPANNSKNYLFTTEVHLQFGYVKGQVFSFTGDDDMWIFVNGKLALDLGSMHLPKTGEIDFDAVAGELGIVPGNTYSMDIFHAERHTSESNFKIETNISCFVPGPIVR